MKTAVRNDNGSIKLLVLVGLLLVAALLHGVEAACCSLQWGFQREFDEATKATKICPADKPYARGVTQCSITVAQSLRTRALGVSDPTCFVESASPRDKYGATMVPPTRGYAFLFDVTVKGSCCESSVSSGLGGMEPPPCLSSVEDIVFESITPTSTPEPSPQPTATVSPSPTASPTCLAPKIVELNTLETQNKKDHHTDKIKDFFALRRADFFKVKVRLSKEYEPECHEVKFETRDIFLSIFDETVINIPEFLIPVPTASWGAERISVVENADGTKTVEMNINIPPTIPVGRYSFKVIVQDRIEEISLAELDFPKDIVMLFNAWSVFDDVYLASDAERNEYIMEQNGLIWRGDRSNNKPKAWYYAQFTNDAVDTILRFLEVESSATRSDAKLVARLFSKLVNANDDSGILVGKWPEEDEVDPYTGGTKPWLWSGSDKILREYNNALGIHSPVEFAQCWVFGGVLTSVLRSVGIPSRPLTNFESAHDENSDSIVDIYLYRNGTIKKESEGIWNYHVWNDVWIESQWHAVDATPQERSDGVFQLGPAPHRSIKAKTPGGIYDVDFVVAEVDATERKWQEDSSGVDRLVRIDKSRVGHKITTKAVGKNEKNDITVAYKTPESRRLQANNNPVSAVVDFVAPTRIEPGQNINLSVSISGGIVDLTTRVLILIQSISYRGDASLGMVATMEDFPVIPAGGTADVILSVPFADYAPFLPLSDVFETVFSVQADWMDDIGSPEQFFLDADILRSRVAAPSQIFKEDPTPALAVGDTSNVTCAFRNILPIDLSGVKIVFSSSEAISFGGETLVEVEVGDVAAATNYSATQAFTALQEGTHLVTCNAIGARVYDPFVDNYIAVFLDCNSNCISDADDIVNGTSFDENLNGVPDECEVPA